MAIRATGAVDVCIVITNHNQGVFLERSIRSCLAQTFPGRFHEVVVVDAGSSDFSKEVIKSYGNRIVPILLDTSSGVDEAAYAGVRRSSARYIVLVRAQDFISDYMILFQSIWLYQNPEHEGVSVDYCLVAPGSDSKLSRVSGLEFQSVYGTMYRKEVFVREGLYGPESQRWAAESVQTQLAKKYRIGHIPIPFYRFQQEEPGYAA